MSHAATPQRSRVPWALAVTVGLCSGLAGYVIHAARVNRIPKQVVTLKRLTDMPGAEESPAISPDGKSVAFVAMSGGRRQIWIQQVSGGSARAITKDDTDHYYPRWSQDSSSLIFYTYTPGTIWEISVEGGAARRMVDSLAPGDLSHDGRRLVFVQSSERGRPKIATCLRDGSALRTLAELGSEFYSNLRWAPDDETIAYMEANDIDSGIWVVNASGGDPIRADAGIRRPQGFTWAPDNSGLIVSTHGELWFVPRKEGATASQLTFGELSYESPDISGDGKLVATRSGLGVDADIVMIFGLKW
jgi:Tol biopolymer transport system component